MSVNKRELCDNIHRRLGKKMHKMHIQSVIHILLEEIVNELLSGKLVSIGNFGAFRISKLGNKRSMNLLTGEIMFTKPSKIIRFSFTERLSKIIRDSYWKSPK